MLLYFTVVLLFGKKSLLPTLNNFKSNQKALSEVYNFIGCERTLARHLENVILFILSSGIFCKLNRFPFMDKAATN